MLLNRVEFTLALTTASPLHVGSGTSRDPSGDTSNTVKEIVRDHLGHPTIPGASIKGFLRENFMYTGKGHAEVFGEIGNRSTGHAGRLTLYNAAIISDADARIKQDGADRSFEQPHNAIDRNTGAVKGNKFFTIEYCQSGTRFTLEGNLKFGQESRTPDVISALAQALSPLFADEFQLGSKKKLGMGKFAPAELVTSTVIRFDAAKKDFTPTDSRADLSEALGGLVQHGSTELAESWSLTLTTNEPFAIADPTNDVRDGDRRVTAALRNGRRPIVPETSINGVLRAEAAWYLALESLNERASETQVPSSRRTGKTLDDRFREEVFNGKAVKEASDLASLTSVERLFGVPGWLGILSLSPVDAQTPLHNGEMPVVYRNIAIDRISGGSLDTALWSSEAFLGGTLNTILRAGAGKGRDEIWQNYRDEDLSFLRRFLTHHLDREGLWIGRSSATGFGHFSVHASLVEKG